jgi:hypothetical protein
MQTLLFVLSLVASAVANDSTPQNQLPATAPIGTKATKQSVKKTPSTKKIISDLVVGQCVILPGGGNLTESPCSSVVLQLVNGKDIIATRTDNDGEFSFTTEYGKTYTVNVDSKFYVVAAPTSAIPSGGKIEIQLKYK